MSLGVTNSQSTTARCSYMTISLLSWSKNTHENVYGRVYLWTDGDMPVAVASIFQFFRGKDDIDAEFQLLKTTPLRAMEEGREVWTPSLATTSMMSTGVPANPNQSQRQMKTAARLVARKFQAEVLNNEVRTRLRLLPQPVHEYKNAEKELAFGAMFAFVDQTDPEVWLMIEARPKDTGDYLWHYRCVRMNTGELSVSLNGIKVWQCDPVSILDNPTSDYIIFQRLQDRAAFRDLLQ